MLCGQGIERERLHVTRRVGRVWDIAGAALVLAALTPLPVLAQEQASERSAFSGDYATVAIGVGALPEYEGANEYRVLPMAGVVGRVGGIGFRLRGPSLTTDLYDDPAGAPFTLRIGPSLRYGANRSGKIEDPVVASLGELKSGFELGLGAGIGFKRLLTAYDRLSLGTSVRRDISGRGGGMTWSASTSYYTPISRAQVVGMHASLEFANTAFGRYNYSVTPEGSARSGLPVFRGKGGLRETNFGLATVYDLNGNLLDGGFAVGAGALYSRLYGSAAKTPITRIRGSRNQWLTGLGLAYTF